MRAWLGIGRSAWSEPWAFPEFERIRRAVSPRDAQLI